MSVLEWLAEYPRQDKIIISNMHRSYTIDDLFVKCHELETYLKEKNIEHVALCADNSFDWLVVDLVCQRNKKCLVPLPTWFTEEQINDSLSETATTHLFLDSHAAVRLSSRKELMDVPGTDLKILKLAGATDPCVPVGTGKITFTSGSTAAPKGVCLSHQQQVDQALALCDAVSIKNPRHLSLLPLSTLLENVAGLYAPLLAEGEVVVPSLKELGYVGSALHEPARMLEIIRRVQPDTMILVPELLRLLIGAIEAGWEAPTSLKFIAVGGAHVSRVLLEMASQANLPVYEGYGISECCSVVTLNTFSNKKIGSCGIPLKNQKISIEDGQICVTGNVMLGYLGLPESWSLQKFMTGDVGFISEEGFINLQGRITNQIISSFGRNISPEWIEARLLGHQAISECVVIGDARPFCVALLTKKDICVSDEELGTWISSINKTLPDYAQIRHWRIITKSFKDYQGLLTANGKLRREAINLRFNTEIESLYANKESLKVNISGEESALI